MISNNTYEPLLDPQTREEEPTTISNGPVTHPLSFNDYIGQESLKQKLQVYTQAARMRNEPLDHTLLFGPPGLGKTTLASIIARSLDAHIIICSGPMMERSGDLVAILTSLNRRDILFIDEIHRMPATVEEVLYNAMEHFRVDIIIGQGAGAKSVNLPISPFTLIGATTKTGMISAPLRSRFGILERLDFYTHEELQTIIQHAADKLSMQLTPEGALTIAKAARGTPRIAKNLLRRVRDVALIHNHATVDELLTQSTLRLLNIDTNGLSAVDRAILSTIENLYHGGPVGLDTIAAIIGEDSTTIEEMYEPYLMRQGLIEKTARGRKLPPQARLFVQKGMKQLSII